MKRFWLCMLLVLLALPGTAFGGEAQAGDPAMIPDLAYFLGKEAEENDPYLVLDVGNQDPTEAI